MKGSRDGILRLIRSEQVESGRRQQSRVLETPVLRFFWTPSHVKNRPFIATYMPNGSTWTYEIALPRLKSPWELPKAYGTIAPVSTIVF